MTDKSNFTPDEWKVLLESVMAAGIAITAAEPSGLWGLLKESFAGGSELAKAKTNPGTNALIKAVVDDFNTTEGSAARDALKNKFKDSKPNQIKDKCIETLRQAAAIIDAKAPGILRPIRLGCSKSASKSPKRQRKADFLPAACP